MPLTLKRRTFFDIATEELAGEKSQHMEVQGYEYDKK